MRIPLKITSHAPHYLVLHTNPIVAVYTIHWFHSQQSKHQSIGLNPLTAIKMVVVVWSRWKVTFQAKVMLHAESQKPIVLKIIYMIKTNDLCHFKPYQLNVRRSITSMLNMMKKRQKMQKLDSYSKKSSTRDFLMRSRPWKPISRWNHLVLSLIPRWQTTYQLPYHNC